MLESVDIQNFRGFERVEMRGLRRVNLIGGRNGVGKTSLLEALCIAGDGGALPLIVLAFRGGERRRLDGFRRVFRDEDVDRGLRIGSRWGGREEVLSLQPTSSWVVSAEPGAEPTRVLRVRREVDGVLDGLGDVTINDSNIGFSFLPTPGGKPGVESRGFALLRSGAPQLEVKRISELLEAKQAASLVEFGRHVDTRLKDVTLLGDPPSLFVDLGGPKLVPVQLAGEGLARAINLASTLGVSRSCVGIDEIENGLHHSVQKVLWRAVMLAARQRQVQIFATTHSAEMIRAASAAAEELGGDDFAYHRVARTERGHEVFSFTGTEVEAAVRNDLEVR